MPSSALPLPDSRHQLGHEGDQTSRPEVSGIEWADHKEGVACAEVGGDESDGFLDDSSTKADMLQSAFSFRYRILLSKTA